MTENERSHPNETLLESWKEIAAYLKRDVRTVIRWEKAEGLPVRRHLHQARSSVYAYASELDAWWATRQPRLEKAAPLAMPWRRPLPALGLVTVLLLALVSVGNGLGLGSVGAAAHEPGAGMTARRIWQGELPYGTVSPDGRYFTYVDWSTGDLAIMNVAPGMNLRSRENRRLTDKGSWAESEEYAENSIVSPDGRQIAYAWFNGNFYDLRIIGLDASEPRVLYANPDVEYLWPGAWSPDGKYVLATLAKADRANQMVLVSVADGSARVLKTVDWRWPSPGPFSPDGRYIVYGFPPEEDSTQRDVYVLAIDGSRETRVVNHPANDGALGWTLEGDHVLFTSDRTGTTDVWAVPVANGKQQGPAELVKPNIGRILLLGFTQDGSLYYGIATSLRDGYIAPFHLPGEGLGDPHRLSERFVGATGWPRWSPDGKYLVYLVKKDRSRGLRSAALVIRSLETGEERELRPDLAMAHTFAIRAALSPDGTSVLLTARDNKGRQGLYLVDAHTAEVTPLVQSEPGTSAQLPAWSPDGSTVFYLRQNRTDNSTMILARNLANGRERTIFRAVEPLLVTGVDVSHDGQKLSFLLQNQTTETTTVVVMPVSGGEPSELFKVKHPDEWISWPTGTAWTPDGGYVLFRRGRGNNPDQPAEIWQIPSTGGEPRKLGEAPSGFLLGLHVHPDGNQIVFTAGRGKAELWVLENFLPELEAQAAKSE